MSLDDPNDLAPEDTGESSAPSSPKKGRQAFKTVTRELSEEDLANPAVQKLLLDDLDRLETENEEHKRYREKFHDADKRVAVLEEKGKTAVAIEILSGACLTIGAAALGYAKVLWSSQPSGWMALVFGFVLLISGIVAKVVKR